MNSKKEMGREIFTLRGELQKGEKVGLFKKWPHLFIAYENGIFIRSIANEKYINAKNIEHIYRNDNILDEKKPWRQLIIWYYQDGERRRYRLSDDYFPGLIEKMEELYKNEWKKYSRNYTESLRWITAVIANWLIVADRPLDLFGAINESTSFIDEDRDLLLNDWGVHNKSELVAMCNRMFSCPTVENAKQYFELRDVNTIPEELLKISDDISTDYERTMKAYDIYRVILLANFGCTARYFTFEEAMEWCLKAGQELQNTYNSWDDFYENYLLGYCYWSEQDADLINTNANKRKRVYYETKKYPTHPWQIPWNTTLQKEW